MMIWNTIVIVACAVLALSKIWLEYRRPNRLRLPLRIIATLIIAVALACIVLPITYATKTVTGIKDGVLLTKGFNPDSLLRYQNSKLFTTETAIQQAYPKYKIALVSDMADILQGKLNIASLHVLGYGLNGEALEQLGYFPIQFSPANLPSGITTINWNHQVKVGESLLVQGKFIGNASKVKIILKGLNTTLDSIIIQPNTNLKPLSNNSSIGSNNATHYGPATTFELKSIPKQLGRATYNLIALDGKDTIENETIPFEVEPAKPIKVLMLSTAPGFESRFLKNWLSGHGYAVAVRTSISKAKFSYDYVNLTQTPLDHLTTGLLDKFDLVVGDLSSFKLLSQPENAALQQQMAQKGLGVIVKADSTGTGTSFLANTFPTDRLTDKTQRTASLLINSQTTPSAKLILDAVFIKPQANNQPLVMDDQNHIMASSTIYGSGKVVFTTLSNTFNWTLSGNQNDYTALWSLLIDKAARKISATQKWNTLPGLPAVNNPISVITEGPTTLPLQIKVQNSNIAFEQNPTLPFSWNATYWPAQSGWQQVTQNGTPVNWWYAFKAADWLTLHAQETILATQKYTAQNIFTKKQTDEQQGDVRVPVSKIYFYILLLLACTYLWVERKL